MWFTFAFDKCYIMTMSNEKENDQHLLDELEKNASAILLKVI